MITRLDFLAFYPQFSAFTPALVMQSYIDQANTRFSLFDEDAEEARRLYAAHKLTLYARTALPDGAESSMALIASTGETQQTVSSKQVDGVKITYATTTAGGETAAASSAFADLPETAYGLQLLALLRLHAGTLYIP